MSSPSPRAATEVDEEIGARIRARRQELDLPMAHVADLIGVAFQQLQKYEAGESRVAVATLMRIAKALKMNAADLLPGAPKAGGRQSKASAEDGMAIQLQRAYERISSKRERRMILDLARRLAADAAPKSRKGTRG